MSSVNHEDFAHLQIPLEDVISATNNFAEKNFIGNHYMGQLLWSGELIDIHAERWNKEWDEKEQQFWMEVSMLSSLKHKNLVSLVGFCDDTDEKVIIFKRETRGSLSKYLSDPVSLTWVRRLEICVGLTHALSCIHYDESRDFSVIHRNIRSSSIQLNDNWEPKLGGFIRSMKIKASERHNSFDTDKVWSTDGYTDPIYIETKSVNHKSDMYSFGMVLFELLCGRKSISEHPDNMYLAPMAIFHYKKKIVDEIIDPVLWKQMDPQSFNVFAETAYNCLNEERSQRPNIHEIVTRLEKALELQLERENIEHSVAAAEVEGTSFSPEEGRNLEHLRIGLNDINEATNNFDDAYCIGSGGFGKVYKADLEHFDSSNSSLIEKVDKCNLPRKRSTVAIKRIHNQKGEQGFMQEIETITTCKHENVISLLGFCYEGNGAMILVYEHASKGSLENYLGSSEKMTILTWVQRLNICLDIAKGLDYIHNNTDHGKQKMIHCDIKSDNILLGDNWEAKIADFGVSKFHQADQAASTIYTYMIVGTYGYLDPEYQKFGILNKKSDIYSFGVVLLEILTGRLAYDSVYTMVNVNGIAPIARDHFEKGTIIEIVDQKIKEETDEHVFCKGPDKESLDIFLKIACQCVAETHKQRPTIESVIKELKKALNCQENHKDNLKLSLDDVKLATQDFSPDNIIGHGYFENVYRGVVTLAHGHNIIAAKRLNRNSVEKDAEFMTELEILMKYKHKNVLGLVGYCYEEDEKVIVYEYASRGSLDKYLSDDSLTWVIRLKICIDIAIGLEFLHGTVSSQEMVIHRDIRSSNILLFDDWKAKLSDFGLSLICPANQDVDYLIDNVTGTIGYRDPLYSETGFLTNESDIFSLGAVLFDILCGKQSSVKLDDECLYLPFLAKNHYYLEKLDKLVFEGIKEQIVPESYITYTRIAFQCIHHRRERRPTAHEVVIQLKKALELQLKPENYDNLIVELDNSTVEGASSFIHNKFQHLKIELQAIKSATNEFDVSQCIGRGGFGKVYRGELVHSKGQSVVALKRLNRACGHGDPEFWNEIIILSQYRHDNIVSLLGFCDDCGERILVYEYASKRSLDLYLDDKDLMWVQRLKICIGVARGLAYLHNPGQTQQRVLHRDIKSSNILLDENWNAWIADFGLSKFGPANQQFTFLVSNGVGTIGYCDPLYAHIGLLTKKSDVYSFGVVLFEMLCGRLCIRYNHNNDKPLTELVHKYYKQKKITDIVYGNIKDEINPDSLKAFTTIAYQCLNGDQEQRPSMTEVVKALESALTYQDSNEPPTSSLSRKLSIS